MYNPAKCAGRLFLGQGACRGKSHRGYEYFRWQPSHCILHDVRDVEYLKRMLSGAESQ